MQFIGVFVATTKSGRWKAYCWGQAAGHISDWTGCNYRYASVEGQPRLGFVESTEAEAWVRERFPTDDHARQWAKRAGDGSHLGESFEKTHKQVTVDLPKRIFPNLKVTVEGHGKTLCGKVLRTHKHTFCVHVPGHGDLLFRRETGNGYGLTDHGFRVRMEDLPSLKELDL